VSRAEPPLAAGEQATSPGAPLSTRRFSISEISTLRASFSEDLAAYAQAGLDGIGIWELKLGDPQGDARSREAFERSGLGAASAVPALPSILPLPLLGGPTDPRERIASLRASIQRLAPFAPEGIVCLTGSGLGLEPRAARATVVDGLSRLAEEAARAGVRLALEPYQADGGAEWTIAHTIPEALELIEEAGGGPSLALQVDVWHLWNSASVLDDLRREIGRVAGVHVCDVRSPTRGWADRVLPGDGVADLPALLGTLEAAGWRGFYDLEIFSDDGSFGTSYPDSLWALEPVELAHRGRAALAAAWESRSETVHDTQHLPHEERTGT
jgi:sugar phosphate isomerase/epimerase